VGGGEEDLQEHYIQEPKNGKIRKTEANGWVSTSKTSIDERKSVWAKQS